MNNKLTCFDCRTEIEFNIKITEFKKYFVRTKCPKCGAEFVSVFELKRVSRTPEYWADKLGLVVWAEMPSFFHFSEKSARRMVREFMDVINRDYNHPCIIAWVPFNRSYRSENGSCHQG